MIVAGVDVVNSSMRPAQGIPITDVSRWLGHQDIGITFRNYGHLVDEAWDERST
ncbi:hypothetical protein ABGB18_33675 [Nonomuraea sp. B12E4]|uniref:hypothetical protein n=1 Tax=Nonomuraea sp. B12E4 TaxID=3153564 RepID=UPI00325DDB58